MAIGDLEKLAEAQRETVQALAVLTEQLRSGPATEKEGEGATGRRGDEATRREGEGTTPALQRALDLTARAVSDLSQATGANTQALTGLSRDLGGLPALLAGLAGGLKDGGGVLGGVLQSGFGFASLGLKIAGLFRGDRPAEQTVLAPFLQPPKMAQEVGNTDDILAGFPTLVRGQQGEARRVEQQKTVVVQPQVTVNVSAMDSRSFLDRSEDIARAMRDAMLHMHPINDLISEL